MEAKHLIRIMEASETEVIEAVSRLVASGKVSASIAFAKLPELRTLASK